MNLDLLLEWMSQVGSSSWAAFKSAVDELSPAEPDAGTYRTVRIALSDVGFADFFVDGTNSWRVLTPKVGGTCAAGEYHFVGARSASTLALLEASAADRGVKIAVKHDPTRPARVEISCSEEAGRLLAADCGLEFCRSLAWEALVGFSPLSSAMGVAAVKAPKNWEVRSFDVESLTWVPNLLPNAACEFTSQHGQRQFFVHLRKRRFIPAGKREAVYIGSAVRGVQLVHYDAGTLSIPFAAPLPEGLARAACCCTGDPSELVDGEILYRKIPLPIAAAISAAAGQRVPLLPKSEAVHG